MKKIAILGSGISGLSCAYYLSSAGYDITVFEKNSSVGGWIQTLNKDGKLLEMGPRGFIGCGKGEKTLSLIKDLKLDSELIQASPHSKKRFLYVRNRLCAIPSHPLKMLLSPLVQPHLISIIKEMFKKVEPKEETIEEFFSRRFSSSFTSIFIDTIISGIFAGDISELSLNASFPQLKKMEIENGSLLRAFLKKKNTKKPLLFSFKNGMQTLPNKIYETLNKKVKFQFSQTIERLSWDKSSITVELKDQKHEFDALVCTIPSNELSLILPKEVNSLVIPTSSLVLVHAFFEEPFKYEGFGYLIPSKENEKILGAIWESQLFSRQPTTHLCAMIGGRHFEEAITLSDKALEEIALDAFSSHLGIKKGPLHISIHRRKNAIPQFTIGHQARSKAFKNSLPPFLFLAGNHFSEGIGINDCICHCERTANDLKAFLAQHSNDEQ